MTRYFDTRELVACLRGCARSEVPCLEKEFARYIGMRHAIGTSFGRTALYVGLRAIGVQGGEVILPAFICTVVRHAVVAAGATPRFVDVDPTTFEMDIDDLRRKITSRARAVLVVHYFGCAARNTQEIAAESRRSGLFLVEDCAHSLGASLGEEKVGRLGAFSVFSLTKSTLNCGGGVLVTESDEIAIRARACLQGSKAGTRRHFVDFPLVAAYGIEQMISKLDRDRVRKHGRRILGLPKAIRISRRRILAIVTRRGNNAAAVRAENADAFRRVDSGYGDLAMVPLIASLARAQLRKIDAFTEKRRRIKKLIGSGISEGQGGSERRNEDACGFLVLRSLGLSAQTVVGAAEQSGLTLRATWPTHQRLWEGQGTEAVARIAREVVTWSINPDLQDIEIARVLAITASLGLSIPPTVTREV